MKQMDIFDYIDSSNQEPMYEIGDRVKIKTAEELGSEDVETVAYLKDYQFGGKVGTVSYIHKGTVISYHVETKKGTAIVSEDELSLY